MLSSRLALLSFFALCPVHAEIALPDLISDHMVIQRDQKIPLWGTSVPQSEIKAELAGHSVSVKADSKGNWHLELPPMAAGGPFEIKISGDGERIVEDVLLGDVWLSSGQSNLTFRMSPNLPWSEGVLDYEKELAAARDPNLRFFPVTVAASAKQQAEVFGNWKVCTPENSRYISAVSYYFARSVQEQTGIPIGIIISGKGATSIKSWMPREVLEEFSDIRPGIAEADRRAEAGAKSLEQLDSVLPSYREAYGRALATDGKVPSFPVPYAHYETSPSYLYNAMIAPLTHVPVRGFLWYQGESDSREAKSYASLFKALIKSRREEWNEPDAPFFFVQLANYDPAMARGDNSTPLGDTWAEQRAAQAEALELPNTAMAVAADVGDAAKIHPRDKKTVGERLARAALKIVYGKDIPFLGPRIQSAVRQGDAVHLVFTLEKGSLASKESPNLPGFELAGIDGIFRPAVARLEGNAVVVSSSAIVEPTQVRYAWANNPTLSLYDTNGLPSPPFVADVRKP